MSTAVMLDRLRARRDAWALFAWLCLGAALMLTVMPGDLPSVHALHTLVGVIALLAGSGAIILALGVLRRERAPRDAAMGVAAFAAGVLVLVTLI
jgi:hypothetical protein